MYGAEPDAGAGEYEGKECSRLLYMTHSTLEESALLEDLPASLKRNSAHAGQKSARPEDVATALFVAECLDEELFVILRTTGQEPPADQSTAPCFLSALFLHSRVLKPA
jgi:hypothetical protein